LVVESLYGFGDHLFIRPTILEEAKHREVYLYCAYPELYRGTNVHLLKPTQGQYSFSDSNSQNFNYEECPKEAMYKRIAYTNLSLQNNETIISSYTSGFEHRSFFEALVPTENQLELGKSLLPDGKVMLVKMPSYSRDWRCDTRNPKIDYMIECIKIAKKHGYKVVSLKGEGDTFSYPDSNYLWEPMIDKFLHGKLSIDEMIGVFAVCDAVLGYPSFLVPLCLSLNKKIFTIYGGHVHPTLIVDPRMKPRNYYYIAPNPFCNCVESVHDCNKEIPMDVVRDKFESFITADCVTDDDLFWDEPSGYGYYPVDNTGVYNDGYFDKYVGYERTQFGDKLNYERVRIANMFSSGTILDIGIGSGQFVRAVDGVGYDVCPKAINWLKSNSKFVDFYKQGAYQADLVTFFDSFEHIEDIKKAVQMCLGRTILISIPIFKDKAHVLKSKHFRKDEHYHYFTDLGLKDWFARQDYSCIFQSSIESDLGREDIGTYVFQRKFL
jgi:hypothetical protein